MKLKNKSRLFVKSKNIKNITIPFLFILTFLLVLFNKTDYFLVNKMKSTSIDVVNPISKAIYYPIQLSINTLDLINNLRLAEKENIKLKEEVIRLKKWQRLALININENKAYKKLLNSTSNNVNIIKTASIVNHSPKIYTRSVLINAGYNHNIEKNFIAINERGLVGKVIFVTKNNSKILLINDQNSSVPVQSVSGNFFAIMKGSSDGHYLESSFIKDNKKPLVGDILVTSGRANIYPYNILVGKIIKITDEKIIALPFVDTKNIKFLQIVKNN